MDITKTKCYVPEKEYYGSESVRGKSEPSKEETKLKQKRPCDKMKNAQKAVGSKLGKDKDKVEVKKATAKETEAAAKSSGETRKEKRRELRMKRNESKKKSNSTEKDSIEKKASLKETREYPLFLDCVTSN